MIFNSCNAGNKSFIDGKPVKVIKALPVLKPVTINTQLSILSPVKVNTGTSHTHITGYRNFIDGKPVKINMRLSILILLVIEASSMENNLI